MEIKTATVSQITSYMKRIFENNAILNNVWIKGEISNFKLHYSGHMYITLKDEGAVLKAVMFKSACRGLSFMPENGMKVLARGRISIYEPTGAYQLYIDEMKPDGIGDLYAQYEALKKKLAAEGLFDAEHKKGLPAFPEKIGVCTATTGAAVRDIINVATRRFPCAEIIIYPTIVQGASAADSIVEAIEYFNAHGAADVLIVGRGGGSIEDLWGFNEEKVAYAIYNSEIPIISAVGHETDFTIADFVADLRAPTPSAAAEIAVPSAAELYSKINTLVGRLQKSIIRANENRRLKIAAFKVRRLDDLIASYCLKADSFVRRMESRAENIFLENKKELSMLAGRLDALSPLSVMARGYSVAVKSGGSVIKSVRDLKADEEFVLRLGDGEKKCRAEE